jgi:hypothetical protein
VAQNVDPEGTLEAIMTIGDYPASAYWVTMRGVAALGMVGVVLMLGVH